MGKVEIPYFKIEIIGKNNINGISREMLITIKKVSLNVASVLEFAQNRLASTELTFNIIDADLDVIYY